MHNGVCTAGRERIFGGMLEEQAASESTTNFSHTQIFFVYVKKKQ